MRIDLHTHTTASDGLLDPAALVRAAQAAGVGILAVADHDSTDGVDPATAEGRRVGVEVVPAVELNTDVPGAEVHILGYCLDHHLPWFERLLARLRDGRLHRAERMVEKLAALGLPVPMTRVLAFAGGGAVGRPHVARALVEAGYITDTAEAFTRYIGRNGPAYVERLKVTPAQAVEIIRRAGGVPVLAHPGWLGDDSMVGDLLAAGLEGIEAYHPDHTPGMVERYLQVAREHALIVTGGTDFHGGDLATRVPIGSQHVPPGAVADLRARAATRRPEPDPPTLDLAAE